MNRTLLLFLLIAATGCRRHVPRGAALDPAAVVEDFRRREVPRALQARFRFSVQGPALSGASTGRLVVSRPDRFRVEILTPLSTPLLVVVCDGRSLHAWRNDRQVFYRGDDAVAVLQRLTGGAVGAADVVALFTAGLPLPGAPVLSARDLGDDRVEAVLQGPRETAVRATIDHRAGLLRALQVEPAGAVVPAARLEWEGEERLRRVRLPEELKADLPSLGWTMEVEVSEWDELGAIPDVFSLSPPAGAEEVDVVAALDALRLDVPRP